MKKEDIPNCAICGGTGVMIFYKINWVCGRCLPKCLKIESEETFNRVKEVIKNG